jgi:hypothetical protein
MFSLQTFIFINKKRKSKATLPFLRDHSIFMTTLFNLYATPLSKSSHISIIMSQSNLLLVNNHRLNILTLEFPFESLGIP